MGQPRAACVDPRDYSEEFATLQLVYARSSVPSNLSHNHERERSDGLFPDCALGQFATGRFAPPRKLDANTTFSKFEKELLRDAITNM